MGFFATKRNRNGRSFKAGRTRGGVFKTRKGEGAWVWRTKKKK